MSSVDPHDSCAVILRARSERPQRRDCALKRVQPRVYREPVALCPINSSKLIFTSARQDRAIFRPLETSGFYRVRGFTLRPRSPRYSIYRSRVHRLRPRIINRSRDCRLFWMALGYRCIAVTTKLTRLNTGKRWAEKNCSTRVIEHLVVRITEPIYVQLHCSCSHWLDKLEVFSTW